MEFRPGRPSQNLISIISRTGVHLNVATVFFFWAGDIVEHTLSTIKLAISRTRLTSHFWRACPLKRPLLRYFCIKALEYLLLALNVKFSESGLKKVKEFRDVQIATMTL